ncbi:hypothetical protein [Nocardia sienata]|uniref:hypothetical protein n=1 Tax=Nocardia sienata TaxID=248552 RepID=UPI0007A55B8E|nr:hypothetical protein [Nocardia sienata]
MAVRFAVSGDFGADSTRSAARWADNPGRRSIRNRAAIVAPTVADAVDCLGGWIFDRTAAGCETVVLLPDPGDTRALDILGAKAIELGAVPTRAGWSAELDVLAVAADMYLATDRFRDESLARRDPLPRQTYLWGRAPVVEFGDRFALVSTHRVSLAGQAFKRVASDAAGVAPGPQSAAETLWADLGRR